MEERLIKQDYDKTKFGDKPKHEFVTLSEEEEKTIYFFAFTAIITTCISILMLFLWLQSIIGN